MHNFITINNKKYFYTLKPASKETTLVECKAANIAQEFLNEDVPALLNDLPHLILAEKDYQKKQETDQATTPHRKRQPEITSVQEMRVVALRKRYLSYSKIKLSYIYERMYSEKLSSWKIQKVIEKYHLYRNPTKTVKITRKRLNGLKRKRITEMRNKKKRATQN